MQTFITDTVLPSLTEYEDVLITREESKIYKEIDKVLGQAIVENIETEEMEDYETVEVKQRETAGEARTGSSLKRPQENIRSTIPSSDASDTIPSDSVGSIPSDTLVEEGGIFSKTTPDRTVTQNLLAQDQYSHTTDNLPVMTQPSAPYSDIDSIQQQQQQPLVITTRKVRRPILKKTFALRRVGYKVIPYEDESDSRYSFTNENVVFVNKANSTYAAEARRGDEFLLRHIIGIVAEAIAESRHPEGRTALELQNRLVAEAIRIHDNTPNKK
jgi:hypothetical protein